MSCFVNIITLETEPLDDTVVAPPTTHLEQNKERIAVQVNYLHLAEPE